MLQINSNTTLGVFGFWCRPLATAAGKFNHDKNPNLFPNPASNNNPNPKVWKAYSLHSALWKNSGGYLLWLEWSRWYLLLYIKS